MNVEDRFWQKVDKSGDCWLWTAAAIPSKGYGLFSVGGRLVYAHRFSYELANGPIPLGVQVDHRYTCPKNCVRPVHLRLATAKQNSENRAGPPRNNTSGVRGVWWYKPTRRWCARVTHGGRVVHLGYFDDLAEAEAVVIAARNNLFTHNDSDRVLR